MRVISQPRYPSPVPPTEAIDRLARATRTDRHRFWPCTVSLLDDRTISLDAAPGAAEDNLAVL